jgi:hypothetical protein
LVAKHQDLDFQRGSRSEQSNQPVPDQFAKRDHQAEASPDSQLIASRIRFATGTGSVHADGSVSIDRLGSLTAQQFERLMAALYPAKERP